MVELKTFGILAAAAVLCLMLTGCGNTDPRKGIVYIGDYGSKYCIGPDLFVYSDLAPSTEPSTRIFRNSPECRGY